MNKTKTFGIGILILLVMILMTSFVYSAECDGVMKSFSRYTRKPVYKIDSYFRVQACCSSRSDCVSQDGICTKKRTAGQITKNNINDKIGYCSSYWFDCDAAESLCNKCGTVQGVTAKWVGSGETTTLGEYGSISNGGVAGSNECCGDDKDENYIDKDCNGNTVAGKCCENPTDKLDSNGKCVDECLVTCQECTTGRDYWNKDKGECQTSGKYRKHDDYSITFSQGTEGDCCGDVYGEYFKPFSRSYTSMFGVKFNVNIKLTNAACCTSRGSCVDKDNNCISGALVGELSTEDVNDKIAYCGGSRNAPRWEDCDAASNSCSKCLNTNDLETPWAKSGEIQKHGEYKLNTDGGDGTTECCGDDKDEFYSPNKCENTPDDVNACCNSADDFVNKKGNCVSVCNIAPTMESLEFKSKAKPGSKLIIKPKNVQDKENNNLIILCSSEDDPNNGNKHVCVSTSTSSDKYSEMECKINIKNNAANNEQQVYYCWVKDPEDFSASQTVEISIDDKPPEITKLVTEPKFLKRFKMKTPKGKRVTKLGLVDD